MSVASPPRSSRTTIIPLVVASALLMENLDSTVLTTAIPSIARDLATDPVHLKLALTAYLMSLAVFVPASGWVADRLGARRVLIVAIGIFTAASLLCALSQSLPQLVGARILQGAGGAMMMPVSRLIVVRSTQKSELVVALSWITIPALVGPIIGPPLGGLAVTYATWHWVFLINIPVGVIGIALCWCLLPRIPAMRRAFDLWGFVLSGAGLSLVVVATSVVSIGAGGIPYAIAGGTIAAVVLWLFIRHAGKHPEPLLDLALFRLPTLRASILGGTFFRIGVGAMPFLLPLLLQIGFNLSPLSSGLITFASGAGALLMKFSAAPILRVVGYRTVLVFNGAVSALFMAAPVLFSPSSPAWIMIGVLFVAGFLRSLQFTAVNALAFAEVDERRMSSATTLSAVAQQIAASLGVSLTATILQISRTNPTAPLTIHDFDLAFAVLAVIASFSVLSFRMLPRTAGSQLIEREPPRASLSAPT